MISGVVSRIFSDVTFLLVASVLQRAATVGVIFFAVGRLAVAEFGALTYAYGTATGLSAFLGDLFASAVLKYVRGKDGEFRAGEIRTAALTTDLLLGAFLAGTIMAVTVGGAVTLVAKNGWLPHALPAGLIAFLIIMNGAWFSILSRCGAVKLGALASASGSFFILLAAYAATELTTASAYLWIMVLGLLWSTACYAFWASRSGLFKVAARFRHFASLKEEHFGFLWKTGLSWALGGPVHWVCLSMLYAAKGGAVQTAIFTAWFQWYLLLNFIPSALVQLTIPWLAQGYEKGYRLLFRRLLLLLAGFGGFSLTFCVLVVLNIDRVLAFYPYSYRDSSRELLIVLSYGVVAGLVTFSTHAYLAAGRVNANLLVNVAYSSSYFLLTAVLVARMDWGALGIALAILASATLQFGIQLGLLHRLQAQANNV